MASTGNSNDVLQSVSTADSQNSRELLNDGVVEDLNNFKLGDFLFRRVLNSNSNRKSIYILGSLNGKDGDAVLTLEKKAFSEADLNENGYFNDVNEVKQHFHNDIYSNYDCFPKPSLNSKFIY